VAKIKITYIDPGGTTYWQDGIFLDKLFHSRVFMFFIDGLSLEIYTFKKNVPQNPD